MRTAVIQIGVKGYERETSRFLQAESAFGRLEAERVRPDLILLPELWSCGFYGFDRYRSSAGYAQEWLQRLGAWAKRLGSYLLGSLVEEREGRLYNTACLLERTGNVCAAYRKIHLFGYGSEEKKLLTPGNTLCVADTDFGRVGLATCYDLRFPEQFRAMAAAGAVCFAVVSAWPMARLSHWRLFNQVRAVENQCFLLSCNCTGEQGGNAYAGHSMAVAPDGRLLFEAGREPGMLWYDADFGEVEASRKNFPAWADRLTEMSLPGEDIRQ